MPRTRFYVLLLILLASMPMVAQHLSVGIAPTFDAGADDMGPTIAEHLALYLYRDLLKGNPFTPELLNPGGAYSSFDTSWLFDYARDRPNLDVLLVTTLKENAKDGSLVVDVALLDAHTGSQLSNWTTTSSGDKKTWMKNLSNSLQAQSGFVSSSNFDKSSLSTPVWHIADSIRDALPSKLAGMHLGSQPESTSTTLAGAPAVPAPPLTPCPTHTHITYAYKHAASRSQLLLVNGFDQTSTLKDGVSTFTLPEGPMLVQFSLNDAPYTMSKQPFYQLSTVHSCAKSTLVIDLGPQGDEHHHWE